MKHPMVMGFVAVSCALLCVSTEASVGRTAYAFRSTDGRFLEIDLPAEAPDVPVWADPASRDLTWSGAGSTRDADAQILSLDFTSAEIVAFDPSSPNHEIVASLGLPIDWTSDLSFGPGGTLILLRDDELYDVELTTGSATLRAQLNQEYHSIEYHQGSFFASGRFQLFLRIDPITHIETPIGPNIYGCGLQGLSSDGSQLWYLMTCSTSGSAPTSTDLGTIDPATGQMTPYIHVVNNLYLETYFGLEVVEQTPSPIPALHPLGLALLTALIGGAGVLVARHSS